MSEGQPPHKACSGIGCAPNCLAPVEFIEYKQVDANASFRRV